MAVKNVEVKKEGNQIVLPEGMSEDTAIEWLTRKKNEAEKQVNIFQEFQNCSPLDALVSFQKALAEVYGWVDLKSSAMSAATMVGVNVGFGKQVQVPLGRIAIPNVAGYVEAQVYTGSKPKFVLTGVTKQKHMKAISELVEVTKRILKEDSIYKGQAIKVSWQWERDGNDFDPTEHSPQYMDLSKVNEKELIFSVDVMRDIAVGLFAPIQYTQACRENKVPLHRGILLAGPPGTGKTQTAYVTAVKAVTNGWTFVYTGSILDLKQAIGLAKQYAPAVVFAEDIDRLVGTERTLDVDGILNDVDGLDTKGAEIITILTTNHVEKISKALLRPGRMDTVVNVKAPDAATAGQLVALYGGKLISPSCDLDIVGEALAGRIPAMIREVVERSKIAAIARMEGEGSIEGHVTESDLLAASGQMDSHARLLIEPKKAQGFPHAVLMHVDSREFERRANGNGASHDTEDSQVGA